MCAACGHQASVIAGTIFQGTRYSRCPSGPGDLVGGQPKKWRQRAGPTARARLGQLPHGVDVAAQAATRDGAAWPGPGVGGGRGGRDPRGRARGGRRPPTPGAAGGHCGRGAGPGHFASGQRVADASADSLLTFVQHAVQPGSVVITDGLQSYRRLPKRGYCHDRRVLLGRGDRPRRSCLASTGSRRSSSAGSWVRIRAASVASISTITGDEFTFRFRRTSRHRGKLFHRLLEQAVAVGPVPCGDGQGYPWSEEETPPQPVVGT